MEVRLPSKGELWKDASTNHNIRIKKVDGTTVYYFDEDYKKASSRNILNFAQTHKFYMKAQNSKAISPDDVTSLKEEFIPDVVFEVVNTMILEKWNGKSATIKQKDIVARIIEGSSLDKDLIYEKHYLDIEDVYRDNGWVVKYDKPAYCEDYDAYFVFTKD